jgi:hypothetical protein
MIPATVSSSGSLIGLKRSAKSRNQPDEVWFSAGFLGMSHGRECGPTREFMHQRHIQLAARSELMY